MNWIKPLLPVVAATLVSACGQQASTADANASATAPAGASDAAPVKLTVPAGTYKLDPTHAFLRFTVEHMGLSDYLIKFTKFDSAITLDPVDITKSKVTLTIDPTSVRTDYPGDYKKTHAKTGFPTWDAELSEGPRYLNSGKFPSIQFSSTSVEQTGPRNAKVTGDLTFLGITKPVVMDVTLHGQVNMHPIQRKPGIGLHAEGTFKRSEFGMSRGPIGDDVKIVFDGEFLHEGGAPAPAGG